MNILAASVHAVLDPNHAFKLDGVEVLAALAEWELRRVRYYSERDLGDRHCLEKLLGLSLLTQSGLTKETVFELGNKGICAGKSGDELLEALRKTPFWRIKTAENQSHLMKLEPDRPAAVFCLKALRLDDPSPGLPSWLSSSVGKDSEGFGERLSRIVFDIAHVDPEASRTFESACIDMLDLQPELIHQFRGIAFKFSPVFSAAFAVKVCQRLLAVVSDDETRAALLNNQALMLSVLRLRQAALDSVEQAIVMRRRMAEEWPHDFLPVLAGTLNNHAQILAALGQHVEALDAVNEAVAIRRQLAEERPETYLPELSVSLNTQANRLSSLGRLDAALVPADEAVAIVRQLADFRPDVFLPNLGAFMNTQANRLSSIGQSQKALGVISEAVAVFRQLVAARPAVFLKDLAGSLSNQARVLADLGHWEMALDLTTEAVAIHRQLATEWPDAFLPNLAESLYNQARVLLALDRWEAALAVSVEAITALRSSFLRFPKARRALLEQMLDLYRSLCVHCNIEPDTNLLQPITEMLRRISDSDSDSDNPK